MNREDIVNTVREMNAAPSCCRELRAAGEHWLNSLGSAEEKAAADALLREVREDVCTLDQTIPFFESEAAAKIFGAERAKSMASHAREIRSAGAKWCDCPACAAGVKIMENSVVLLGGTIK